MMIGAPMSGILVHRTGPKFLVTLAVATVALAVGLLSQLNADTSTLQIAATTALFGLAGGLGLAPLTDMVMASIPVDDAGIGSAMNDVSRELGAALGIAAIGSFVSSLYRDNIEKSFEQTLPGDLLETAGEGIGVATVVGHSLPPEVQGTFVSLTQTAFVDAFTIGCMLSAMLLATTAVFAAVLVPSKFRTTQMESSDGQPGATPATGAIFERAAEAPGA
jgi:hypothetical protein